MPGISAATFRGRRFFLAGPERRGPADPQKRPCTMTFSFSRCKMGCNCGRRAAVAAATQHQRPSVRRSGRRGGGNPPPPPPPPPSPAVWGPPLWVALHTAAQFTTTENQRSVWIDLLEAMRTALPCDECSAHYNTWINAHPVAPALPPSGTDLQVGISTWILDLHNNVNDRKNVRRWTLDEVTATYIDKARTTAAVASLRPYIDGPFLDRFGPLL